MQFYSVIALIKSLFDDDLYMAYDSLTASITYVISVICSFYRYRFRNFAD